LTYISFANFSHTSLRVNCCSRDSLQMLPVSGFNGSVVIRYRGLHPVIWLPVDVSSCELIHLATAVYPQKTGPRSTNSSWSLSLATPPLPVSSHTGASAAALGRSFAARSSMPVLPGIQSALASRDGGATPGQTRPQLPRAYAVAGAGTRHPRSFEFSRPRGAGPSQCVTLVASHVPATTLQET
jgi:hypothetical protein